MPGSETPRQATPVGVVFVGALLLGAGGIGGLIGLAGVIAALTNFGETVGWWLGLGAAVTELLAYIAIRVGLSLLRDPAENRIAAERAVWAMIPIVWVAIGGISAYVMKGTIDPFMILISVAGALFWSAVLAAGAFYLRSSRLRSHSTLLD